MSKLKSRKGFTPHLLWGKNRNCPAFCKKGAGFTLIELLIVIAIIAIIAAVVYVALDPATRFKNARVSTRWTDVSAILSAIKVDQIDNGGSYVTSATWKKNLKDWPNDVITMIGTDASGCDGYTCNVTVATGTCIDLGDLVSEGYIASVPFSPEGNDTWTAGHTGYTLEKQQAGKIIEITACDTEESGVSVAR